ncbi:DUF2326 domain-containing protein [Streptococcus alactolyticus]|jgi:hypothetical protein|uniref:DUF2326 domain-containing protein n=1 Tax=Bacillota TaxID=1239 RepID=UPI002AA44A87|nr:DUF2326 domain-containing protein [Bacteroidales bacterium]HEM2810093.1 DUF2326 domain-containing protein [Streptococcus suis]
MLYEIECEKFAKKVNGQLVPRGRIQLREGLNTVLGDKAAQNSIGKSTFLLVVDFCFGGDDYINPKICKAKEKLHSHTINFAFKFGNRIDYFCRSTKTPSEIGICDSDYKVLRTQTLKEFKDYLLEAYGITTPSISFREMVGRFLRIYGRENYAERYPLKYGDVKPEASIETLEKMFNVFAFIEEYKSVYDDKSKRTKVRDDATKLGEMTNVARTKKEYNANEKEIERLKAELQKLMDREDAELSQEETDNLDKASEIRGQLTVLKRRRSRLVSQLNAVKANMSGGLVPVEEDLSELSEFFPDVDVQKLSQIEHFHDKMQRILSQEMGDEIAQLQILIDAVSAEMARLQEAQRKLGVPVTVSKKFMDQVVDIQRKIDILTAKNKAYDKTAKLKTEKKDAKIQLEDVRETQLQVVETSINQEMTRLNDYIYGGERYAPTIKFGNSRSGKPTYDFWTEDDTGAGTNFKGLIIFDLALLRLTELPVIAHDSNIFKNIADLPIDKIMELYNQSKKQIFIAFDKEDTFYDVTRDIVHSTTIIELHENGGELFGWSWAKKAAREKQIATETGVIEES